MSKDTLPEPQVLSVSTAAKMLSIGRNFAYELCRTGRLPHLRLGRRILIPKRALEELLEHPHLNGSLPADSIEKGSVSYESRS